MLSNKKKEQRELSDTLDTDMERDLEYIDLDDENASKPPKKKLPGWVIFPIIAVFIIIIIVASVLSKGSSKAKTTMLHVSRVTDGNIKEIFNASGKIESENTKTYYSPVTAPVTKLNAIVGNTVKSGDLLVTYDTTNLERDNQQAQLNVQTSRNNAASAKAKNAKAIDAANAASAQAADKANELADKVNELAPQVNAAYDQYQANIAAAAPDIQKLQNDIDQSKAAMQEDQDVMNTVDTGYKGRAPEYVAAKNKIEQDPNYVPSDVEKALIKAFDSYYQAQSDYQKQQQTITDATNELNKLKDNVDDAGYNDLKAAYDAANSQYEAAYAAANSTASAPAADAGMSSADMANLDISDNLAELAALTPAELVQKGKEGMKADMNGVIASVATLQTNAATQGMAMFSIASTDKVRVKLEVSPDDYDKLKEGNKATITVGDFKYNGTLTKVDKIAVDNAKGNPVIGAEIHIDNPDKNICIGATSKIKMTVAEAKDVLVVPTEVINTSSKGDFVYVIENGIVKEKPVELGITSTTQAEVKSGLKKGDKVVNDLNVDIKKGMKATPVEKKNTSAQKE